MRKDKGSRARIYMFGVRVYVCVRDIILWWCCARLSSVRDVVWCAGHYLSGILTLR